MKRVLFDMDGVLADFNEMLLETYRREHPDKPFIPLEKITTFYTAQSYPEEVRPLLYDICQRKGFYRSLSPIEGAIEGFLAAAKKVDAWICTSPLLSNPTCASEKFEWVDYYLGSEWARRTIITKDKTLVVADELVDDKPVIKGAQDPTWEHIVFDQPYNRDQTQKRRMNWKNWESILL